MFPVTGSAKTGPTETRVRAPEWKWRFLTMKSKHRTPEQVIRRLAEGDEMLKMESPSLKWPAPSEAPRPPGTWYLVSKEEHLRRNEGDRDPATEEARRRPGTRHRHVEGDRPEKLITPDRRRRAVERLRSRFGVIGRTTRNIGGLCVHHRASGSVRSRSDLPGAVCTWMQHHPEDLLRVPEVRSFQAEPMGPRHHRDPRRLLANRTKITTGNQNPSLTA